jgi:hypothetical protein
VGFSMIPLLMHSDSISQEARQAVRAVTTAASPEQRTEMRKEAARLLYRETGLECAEVLDLVGLDRTLAKG